MWDMNTPFMVNATNLKITTQNSPICGHVDTTTRWEVKWTVNDPYGIQSEALTDGCVRINFKILISVDFGTGSVCFFETCPVNLLNWMEVTIPVYVNDVEFTLINPDNALDYVTIPCSALTSDSNPKYGYYLNGYSCYYNTYVEDNFGSVEGNVTSSAPFACKELKWVTMKPESFEYLFYKGGNPDLVTSEAIAPLALTNYSVQLNKIEYDWCNP